MEIGKINTLTASRSTGNGYYLVDEEDNEVLLPNSYVTEDIRIGSELDVFVYKDSEDRIVAVTNTPYVLLNQFAFLKVKDVNPAGAFFDWGLQKDLLVPYAEQIGELKAGDWRLVFLLKDEKTERLIGSCKSNQFFFFDEIDVAAGDEVDLLIYQPNDLGFNAVVNNLYKGLIFHSDIHKDIQPGDKVKGYIRLVREDGKLDIALEPIGYKNAIDSTSQHILTRLKENNGILNVHDKSDPDLIKQLFGLSKKAFKRSIGFLYKEKIISIEKNHIELVNRSLPTHFRD
ncbi:MAG: S1 RNA-binding domain-containing protein [Cyclobacteriaceae bacterium]